MENYILFDTKKNYENLLPLTFTRPVSDLRVGIMTIKEKWEYYFDTSFSVLTQDYMKSKYPTIIKRENILINSSILPDDKIIQAISELKNNNYLKQNDIIIAVKLDKQGVENFESLNFLNLFSINYPNEIDRIEQVWQIFSKNGKEIERDFFNITKGRKSISISNTNTVFNEKNIFVEEGAEIECSVLNAKDGYIYIAKNAIIMENCVIRGSLALGENSQLKVGTTIYGPTTIGFGSKVGGEINNSVIWGNSNKAHDGFLGNSVLGEWCNLGAGTNNSNLKNNYLPVKLWNYREQSFVKTGLQFCGLVMGDHSKCGINTMFNTGTVVGLSANIYGTGFPRNFIPSFSWGGAHGLTDYQLNKAIETAQIVLSRRNLEFTDMDNHIFEHVYNLTHSFRKNF
jgi:UDP-N-acetylglucosamine diphosphorylase/glucosamine-1-phosphate N-acetyltransferase